MLTPRQLALLNSVPMASLFRFTPAPIGKSAEEIRTERAEKLAKAEESKKKKKAGLVICLN